MPKSPKPPTDAHEYESKLTALEKTLKELAVNLERVKAETDAMWAELAREKSRKK